MPYFKAAPNGHHYYRRPVPPALWDILGRREIKKALGSDHTDAVRLYAQVHKEAEQAIKAAKAQGPVDTGDRAAVVRRMRQSGLFSAADIALLAGGKVEPHSDLDALTGIFQDQLADEYEAAERKRLAPKVSLEAIQAIGKRKLPEEVHTIASTLTHYLSVKSTGVHARDLALTNRVKRIGVHLTTVLGKAAVTKRPLQELSRQEARKMRDHLAAQMAPASVKRSLEIISPAINAMIKEHDLDMRNPFSGLEIKGATNSRGARLPLNEDDMNALAPTMNTDDALGAIWITLRDTGARLGEVCNLRAMDLDLANKAMMIRPYGDHTLKTENSERTVPLSPVSYTALKALADALAPEAPLFPSYAGPRRSETASAALMKRLRTVVSEKKKVVHSLRHRMKDLLRVECPEALAQEIMGHSGQKIAFNYGAGYALEAKRKALEKVW
nr:tyrosine-type recombinase/integrase [Mesorhizobium amorphae]